MGEDLGKCQKMKQHSMYMVGKTGKSKCENNAIVVVNGIPMCRHHARKGRYVFRIGDTGEILARFDTLKELSENQHLYPNANPQHLTKSHRRNISKRELNEIKP